MFFCEGLNIFFFERNSVDLSIISISRNVSSELMTITLDEEMQGGDQYHIHIQFSGIMKDISMDYGPFSHKDYGGFFRGSYENMDNKRRYINHSIYEYSL
jgi:hypothetical protein